MNGLSWIQSFVKTIFSFILRNPSVAEAPDPFTLAPRRGLRRQLAGTKGW